MVNKRELTPRVLTVETPVRTTFPSRERVSEETDTGELGCQDIKKLAQETNSQLEFLVPYDSRLKFLVSE